LNRCKEDPVQIKRIACPIDYSDCSRRALRYAGALAEHFHVPLDVLHVVDPLLVTASAIHQVDVLGAEARAELEAFARRELPSTVKTDASMAKGAPDKEIVRYVEDREADLIVMGTHGLQGLRRAFFGSTARGVLRRTQVPVLAVPLHETRRPDPERPLETAGPVIAAVDLTETSAGVARAAAALARALKVPCVLLHVEKTGNPARWARAENLLKELGAGAGTEVETLVTRGGTAAEISRHARERTASVVVMALSDVGARAGSVTYDVLCETEVPVLAIPRKVAADRLAAAACAIVEGGAW
jgi:nucleotide-binding universal stress UspA family protein